MVVSYKMDKDRRGDFIMFNKNALPAAFWTRAKNVVLNVVFIIICLFVSTAAFAEENRTIKADIQSIRIPEGSYLKLELIDPVSTKTGGAGDEFNAMLKEDQIVNGTVVLPAGSVFRGMISKIVPAKSLSRCAVLYVNFDHVVTTTGRQIPVTAGIYNYPSLTVDGGIFEGGNYGWALQQNWAHTKKIVKTTIDWGKGTGDNMQYVCVPIGAAGGVIGGAFYLVGDSIVDLFKTGSNVNLEQGQILDIMLTQPIDIPVH